MTSSDMVCCKNTLQEKQSSQDSNIFSKETHNIIAYNLNQLLSATKMSRKDLAALLGVSPATVTAWLNQVPNSSTSNGTKSKDSSSTNFATPSISILREIKERYHISLDDFTEHYLEISEHGSFSRVAPTDVDKYHWYLGTYYCYYFDTSSYKGRDRSPEDAALCYGIIHIYEVPSPISGSDFKVIAIFGLKDKTRVREIAEHLNYFKEPEKTDLLLDQYEKQQREQKRYPLAHFSRYFGELVLGDAHLFLNLNYRTKDCAFLIFNRPSGRNPEYYGGLGSINSISRGAEPCPCNQYIGISKVLLDAPPEAICQNLTLGTLIKAREEADQIISLCKHHLNRQTDHDSKKSFYVLNDTQLALTVQAQLEAKLNKAVERNLYRCAKVSKRDDDEWYHFIKNDVEAFLAQQAE